MKIAVTANGQDLDALTSPFFGRCPWYVLVETETLECEAIANPALSASGGAGIQAAQYLIEQGAQAIVSGNVGPNAFQVLRAAGIPVYLSASGTVRQAVESFQASQLESAQSPTAPSHIGLGGGGRGGGRRRGGQ
ncbi:MAG: NifB/NifX family molybdenum-iron cluster-binding protein [Anaerolineae bacterium]|nr:NifB/NifX family molybdenum-iron cluster-binding protein [Anaerolineae bacterium]